MDLFSSENDIELINLKLMNADISYYPNLFSAEESVKLFNLLYKETPWKQDDIVVFGKKYKQPRLTALYGEKNMPYTYSGITMYPSTFTKTLLQLKNKIEKITSIQFNAVLLNLYRDGNDSVGWHSDNEEELGANPEIASLSFGTERMFHLRKTEDKILQKKILLQNGSLLLMKGKTQHFWQHQIPKSKKISQPRINLTFRVIQ